MKHIKNLNPGTELDILIAKKIMGWIEHNYIRYGMWKAEVTEHPTTIYHPPEMSRKDVFRQREDMFLPQFSSDITDAWSVVKKIGKPIDISGSDKIGYRVSFAGSHYREAKTLPHAICLAALAIRQLPKVKND